MLKIQMLEQILNNDENINDDSTKSQVSNIDESETSYEGQYGYFVQNGSSFSG